MILHPETVLDQPRALRWVVDTGAIPCGAVRRAPAPLGAMLEDGPISRILVEQGALWVWLHDAAAWVDRGPAIRNAIAEAVRRPGWQVEPTPEVLDLVARDVIAGCLGDYIASHGGVVTVVETTAVDVVVEMGGACADCPAAGITLHQRIERSIRARYPGLREVRRQPGAARWSRFAVSGSA